MTSGASTSSISRSQIHPGRYQRRSEGKSRGGLGAGRFHGPAFNVPAFSGDPVLFFTWLLDRAENDAILQSTRRPVSNRRKLKKLPPGALRRPRLAGRPI